MAIQSLMLPITVITLSFLTTPSTSSTDTFVFGGCSQLKYAPSSPYEWSVNSVLTSIVNSATFTTYNNFTSAASSSSADDTVYGLFQCRGDLSVNDCGRCVARAVSQLGSICAQSVGAALQLEGCFIKYDNETFLGKEDTTVVLKRCGSLLLNNPDALTRRDAVLGYLGGNDGSYRPYRVGGSGNVYGVAQCTQDLSTTACQDCLSNAIGRLKTDCATSASGDVYLGKCYVRFSVGGAHSHGGNGNNNNNNSSSNDDEIEKTLVILVGLIAGVALLIIFLSFLRKVCDKGKEGK